jgi:hypothetical protein
MASRTLEMSDIEDYSGPSKDHGEKKGQDALGGANKKMVKATGKTPGPPNANLDRRHAGPLWRKLYGRKKIFKTGAKKRQYPVFEPRSNLVSNSILSKRSRLYQHSRPVDILSPAPTPTTCFENSIAISVWLLLEFLGSCFLLLGHS